MGSGRPGQGQDGREGELGLTPIQVSARRARGESVAFLLLRKGNSYKRSKPNKVSHPQTSYLI